MKMDAKPYQVWRKLKDKYPVATVQLTEQELGVVGLRASFKSHRDYVNYKFKQMGIEILRWQHDYDSLTGVDPKLGVVFLAGDTVLQNILEAHVLIGHNAKHVETT